MRNVRSSAASSSFQSRNRPIEPLERRRLLSVAVNSGVLTITGTSSGDAYFVALTGANITVTENGGGPQSFAASGVSSILANLGGGADSLSIADSIVKNAVLNGEAGNDTIIGGGGADTLDGGIGNDSLDGGAGLDTVSYAARSAAVTANLAVKYDQLSGTFISLTGSGGENGETDAYLDIETLTGGSGNDTLSTSAGILEEASSTAITLRLNGGGGADLLRLAGAKNLDTPTGQPFIIGDGGTGNDDLYFPLASRNSVTAMGGDGDDLFRNDSDSIAIIDPGIGYDTFNFYSVGITDFTMPLGLEKVVAGGGQAPTITGNGEANRIELSGAGTAFGVGGDDTLIGGGGSNVFDGGSGNDSIDGGGGNDTISYSSHSTPVTASVTFAFASNDLTLTGTGGSSGETDTYANIESITGGTGNDTLTITTTGTIPANFLGGGQLNGGDGNDTLTGGGGAETLDGGLGNDSMNGGAGVDTVCYASHTAAVTANILAIFEPPSGASGGGAWQLRGGGGQAGETDAFANLESLAGGAGNDTLSIKGVISLRGEVTPNISLRLEGGAGSDQLTLSGDQDDDGVNRTFVTGDGGADNDTILIAADSKSDTITLFGGDGNDTINGSGGDRNDSIDGGNGNDVIRVNQNGNIEVLGSGKAKVDGGSGDDLIVINGGTDTVHGGDGNDSIYAGVGDDRVFGDADDDRLNGDGGKDAIYGGSGNDRVYGNSGADRIFGESGVDRLYGGNKNDYLDGGAGADYLKGDEDTDTAKKDKKDRRYEGIEVFA